MNYINMAQRRTASRFFAVLTAVSLMLSAFPATFSVARADEIEDDHEGQKVLICHLAGKSGNFIMPGHDEGGIPVTAIVNHGEGGHGNHDGDIIPVLEGFPDGVNLDTEYNGKTGAEWLGEGKCPPSKGSITIRKIAGDDTSTEFDFTGTGEIGGFTLVGGSDEEFEHLQPGEYTITESDEDGWNLLDIACEGDGVEWEESLPSVIIDLEAGDDVSCTFTNRPAPPAVDYCDPSQRPDGMSIAEWHDANDFDSASCFGYEVTQQCGSLDVQFTTNETPYAYLFHYALGSETPELANWEGDGPLPVNFAEDENGGSVDVTYYVVGPESDFFTGSGIPNIWDGNGATVSVDTDCEKEFVSQCIVETPNLLVNGSFEEDHGLLDGAWGIFNPVLGWAISLSDGLEIWRNMAQNDPSDGEQNAELDGNDATKITQTVATTPGATYELSFDFAARSDASDADNNHIEATADGTTLVNQSTDNTEWVRYGATFVADESTDISFEDLGVPQDPGGTGTLLDNAVLCLVSEPEDCYGKVEARVVLQDGENDVQNGGNGNLEQVVILGDGTEVPFGQWFDLSVSGNSIDWIDDFESANDYTDPADKAGLFVSREGDGTVMVALYGYHNPGGDVNYESLRATIEFNDVTVSGVSNLPAPYGLENHSEVDGVLSNDYFDDKNFTAGGTSVDFDFWVDTVADGIKITLDEEEIVPCDDDTDPVDPEPETIRIDGYKYEVLGEEYFETLSGWYISLTDGDEELMSTTTDDNGYYYFDVVPGYYEVHEQLQSNWEQWAVEQNDYPIQYEGEGYCEFGYQPLYFKTTEFQTYDYDLADDVAPIGYTCDFYNEYIGEEPPVDVCINIPGDQSELPQGYEFTDVNYCEQIEEDDESSSYSSGTRIKKPTPQVLGESTTNFCPFLTDYMQMGWSNDPLEVTKLQMFLNMFKDTYGGTPNPVTGFFGAITDANVKAFQEHYHDDIITPWYVRGIVPHHEPTGFVYKTTLWKINSIVCPDFAVLPTYEGENLLVNVDIDVAPISD